MARLTVHHSDDACCIEIRGDKARPEPSTAVVKFPGGHVEVSRHSKVAAELIEAVRRAA